MTCPEQIYAGDSLEFTVTVDDFLASDGWALVYQFAPRFTTPTVAPFAINATNDGDRTHTITRTAVQTASWTSGAYNWWRWVERTVSGTYQRQVLDDLYSRGQLLVLQNPATATQGFDNRSQARKALDDLLALRASAASGGKWNVVEYRIGERMMKFGTPVDLDNAISNLRLEVSRELRAEEIAKGLPDRRKIYTRAGRA